MDRFYMFIATGGYSGYLPKAPGTWGSLVGLLLYLPLHFLPMHQYAIVLAALLVLGIVAAGAAEKIVDRPDPGLVVIDEIVGILITLAGVPLHPLFLLLGFVFFRIFDILKPCPVGWLDDHIHGGLGIMLDDVAAGICGMAVMQLVLRII